MVNLRKEALAFFLLSGILLFGCNNQNIQKDKSEKVISQKDNSKRTYLSGESRQEISKTPTQEIEQRDYFRKVQENIPRSIEKISIETDDEKFEKELRNWNSWDYNSPFALRIQVLDKESKMPLEKVLVKIKKSNGAWADDIITKIEHKGKPHFKNFYLDSTEDKGLAIFCLRKRDLDAYVFDNSIITMTKEGYYSKDFIFLFKQFQGFLVNSEAFSADYDSSLKLADVRFNKNKKGKFRVIFNNEANEEDYREQVMNLQTRFKNRPYSYVHDQLVEVIDLEILMNPIKEKTY